MSSEMWKWRYLQIEKRFKRVEQLYLIVVDPSLGRAHKVTNLWRHLGKKLVRVIGDMSHVAICALSTLSMRIKLSH